MCGLAPAPQRPGSALPARPSATSTRSMIFLVVEFACPKLRCTACDSSSECGACRTYAPPDTDSTISTVMVVTRLRRTSSGLRARLWRRSYRAPARSSGLVAFCDAQGALKWDVHRALRLHEWNGNVELQQFPRTAAGRMVSARVPHRGLSSIRNGRSIEIIHDKVTK
jgi:hypothetical protein